MNRLILLVESRIRGNVYVRFGGEHLKTHHRNMTGRRVLSLLSLKVFKGKLEDTYTVLLSRFTFNKSECEQCPRNSEFYSLFPVFENSRCTNSSCLNKKQHDYVVDGVLAAMGNENLTVYVKTGGSLHSEVVRRLGELGIEVKTGQVYPMPVEPVVPLEEDYVDYQGAYVQAKADFNAKLTKWNSFQDLLGNGAARKVILVENNTPTPGYIVTPVEPKKHNDAPVDIDETPEHDPVPDPDLEDDQDEGYDEDDHDDSFSENTGISPVLTVVPAESEPQEIQSDLLSMLQEKDRKNREDAMLKVIADAKKLLNDAIIPPVEFTPFEDTLMNFVMLPCLKPKQHEIFEILDGQVVAGEIRFNLHNSQSDDQKNVLKREFLLYWLVQTLRIDRKSELLLELVKYHFPDDMAEIEHVHNEEYME